MSAFSPINVAAGSQQKKALLQRLMEQFQQNAARAAGMAAAGAAGGVPVTAGAAHHQFGGLGHITHPFVSPGQGGGPPGLGRGAPLPPGLAAALGPGGLGHLIAGRSSSAPGIAIASNIGAHPYQGSVLAPSGPSAPIAPASQATSVAPTSPQANSIDLGNGLIYHVPTGQVMVSTAGGAAGSRAVAV